MLGSKVKGKVIAEELGEAGIVSVVPGIVVNEPSGSVDVEGGIVVSEGAPVRGESEITGSVVPGIVVKDPSGSVDTDGGIVVSD